MRVLIGADVSSNPHGGVAQILYNLQSHLRLEGTQADLLFLDAVPKWLRALVPGRIAFPILFFINAIKGRKKYDVIQGQGSNGWLYGIFRRIFKNHLPPYVLLSFELENLVWRMELREAFLKRTRVRFKTKLSYPLTKLLPLQIALRSADHLIVSYHDVEYVKSRFTNYTVQPNSVPSAFFINRKHTESSPVGVMFNLTWHWRKNIYDLPDLLGEILALDDVFVTLVTPQPPSHLLEIRRRFPDRLLLHSDIEPDKLLSLYRNNSIFVDPSICAPVPLLVVLEAMAAGMAVVMSSLAYADRIIEHGYNGYLVTPRDVEGIVKRVAFLTKNVPLRQAMGQRAQETARQYEWRRGVRNYVKVYEMLSK